MRAAIHDGTTIINVIIANSTDGFDLDDGLELEALPDDSPAGPGWVRDGTGWTAPPPPELDPSVPAPGQVEAATLAVVAMVVQSRAATGDLTIAEATAVAPAFPMWAPGEAVAPGDLRYHDGSLVEAVQAHTTQADWTPPATPALWKTYRDTETAAPWVQPQGAHDAYAQGAKVTHNQKTWTSNVDGNVWAPPTQWTEAP